MRRQSWLVLVLLMALPALAFGQAQTTGRINGRVTDDQGAPLAGATITVNNTELQLERTTTTGPNGEFLFALLPTGPYSATVTSEGRQPQVLTFRLGIGETVPLNVTLSPGDVIAEEITVTGTATALETTSIGENFDYEQEVEQLPIPDRDIEDVAALSPNISFGPTGGTLSIAGAPSFDTTVLLDGAEVSDPYFGSAPTVYIEDAIEEVQVLTSGVSARYGRFQGGVINAITKSGSNDFEGTARVELEKETWNSKTPYSREQQDDTLNRVYQATLGGYILRDRLWFFAGGRTIPEEGNTFTTANTGESYTEISNEERWQGKLRAALTENHLVDLSYLKYEAETDPYDGLGAGDDRALGKRSDPRETFTFAYQGVLSSNTFLELQATQKSVEILAGGDPALGDPLLDANNTIVFNNHWWDFNDASVRDNETAALNVTHSLGTESFGSHTLEAGVQYVNSITGGENRQSSTGLNLLAVNSNDDFYAGEVNGDPRFNLYSFEALRWEALPLGGEQELKNTAVYLQDGVNLGKFRFDLGVRYDQYDGSGPLPSFNIDFDGFSPRVGVTYNVTPSWQVQGTYGRYISRFNDNVGNAVTGVGSAPRITTLYTGPDILNGTAAQLQTALRNDAFWSIILEYLDPTQPTTFVANDVDAPYADDYNFSLRHALPRNTGSVVLSYINREYKNLLDDFRGGVCSDFGLDVDNCSDFTTVIDTEGQPTTLDTIVWANNDAATREYEAITALWDYRPSSNWLLSGNYTYAKTEGNYEGEGQNTPASGSIQGDFVRSIDQAAAVPFGYTDDDIRHRLIAMGSYTWDLQRFGAFSLGSIFRYRSGLPYSLTATVPVQDDPDYLGDDGSTYTYYFGRNGEIDRHERNARRFDGFWALDLSTRYELPVFRDLNVFLKLSATNVTNNDAVVRHSTSVAARLDANGEVIGFRTVGNCGLGAEPSESCTGFGRIRNELDYQAPREFLFTVAVDF